MGESGLTGSEFLFAMVVLFVGANLSAEFARPIHGATMPVFLVWTVLASIGLHTHWYFGPNSENVKSMPGFWHWLTVPCGLVFAGVVAFGVWEVVVQVADGDVSGLRDKTWFHSKWSYVGILYVVSYFAGIGAWLAVYELRRQRHPEKLS